VSAGELVGATVVMVVGGALQGSIGFGSLLLAAPVLALIDPGLVPGPTALAGTVLVLLIARRERRSVEWTGVGWVLAGRVPGTAAGGAVLGLLSQRSVEVLFGTLLLLAVALSAYAADVRRSPLVLLGAGALSGVMGTATSVGGPALALVYQGESGPVIRGTLNVIFIAGSALTLVALALVGRLGTEELVAGAVLTPGIVAGFLLSRWLVPHVDRRALRPAVLTVAGAAALAVLVRALA